MALTSTDERDLLVPLYGSITDAALWPEFAGKLLARLHAQRLAILLRATEDTGLPQQQIFATWGATQTQALDIAALSAAGLLPYASLRPNRVYALEEMLLREAQTIDKLQQNLLKQGGFSYARFLRIAGKAQNLWLIAVQDDRDFAAADAALLSAIAPHISVALDAMYQYDVLQLRAAIAEDALALLGIAQIALDRDGEPVFTGPRAAEIFNSAGRVGEEWAKASTALDGASPDQRRIILAADSSQNAVILRPAPALTPFALKPAAATATLRTPRPKNPQNTAKAIAALLGLSNSEAALAEAMCRGLSIIEAGASLHLTPETARNYSKRIYAKSGARGQADLVRIILNSLAPLG